MTPGDWYSIPDQHVVLGAEALTITLMVPVWALHQLTLRNYLRGPGR